MRIQLRRAKYDSPVAVPIKYENVVMDFPGAGTQDDPVIIDAIWAGSLTLEILDNDFFILISNCILKDLNIFYSKNISLIDCRFERLHLGNCENMQLKRVVNDWGGIDQSHKCLFVEVIFKESVAIYKSNNNVFKKCKFCYIYDLYSRSRNNVFIDNEVPKFSQISVQSMENTENDEDNSFLLNTHSGFRGYKSLIVKCQGKGINSDPYIIDSLESAGSTIISIVLSHSRDYLIFKNIEIKNIRVYDTQNIQFYNCNFEKTFLLKFCSNIKIFSSHSKKLKLCECNDLEIVESKFKKIALFRGCDTEIKLKNCEYKKIDKKLKLRKKL